MTGLTCWVMRIYELDCLTHPVLLDELSGLNFVATTTKRDKNPYKLEVI